MGTGNENGRVWGAQNAINTWLALRWQYAMSQPFASLEMVAFVASDDVDPNGAPANRVQMSLVDRRGNLALWRVTRLILCYVDPLNLLAVGCAWWDPVRLDWDMSQQQVPTRWGCVPGVGGACPIWDMFLDSATNLHVLTVRPEPRPGQHVSEGWEYAVHAFVPSAPPDLPALWLQAVDQHRPDASLAEMDEPYDVAPLVVGQSALGSPLKGSKLL